MIGLKYVDEQLVEKADSISYRNTKFSFYQMDVDRDSFSADFQKLCTEPEDRLDRLSFLCINAFA